MIEDLVYKYLCAHHLGKDNLVKNKELRKLFSIRSDKSMRKVIQNIREDENYPRIVGSVSGKNGGFYICIRDIEEQDTIDNINHRAYEMLNMTKILEKKRGNRR